MSRRRLLHLIILGLAGAPSMASAHGGEAHEGWSIEPVALGLLVLSILIYISGWLRMSANQRSAIAPLPRLLAYGGAVAVLVAALFSPIDARADSSFAWHMAQHLLLMLGAAPLLALSNTHLVALFALPIGQRRHAGRFVSRTPGVRAGGSNRLAPMVAAALFALGLWLWHAPRLYEEALANEQLHTLEHLTFLITAAVFWRMIATSGNRRLDAGTSIVLVTLVGLQGNLLAALITLAPEPLYSSYASRPLLDQQIAGLLMWVPAGLIYLSATLVAIRRLVAHVPRGQPLMARMTTTPAVERNGEPHAGTPR